MPEALIVWPQISKIPEYATISNYRTLPSWLFGAQLSARDDSPLVPLIPFWSLPFLLEKLNHQQLLICTKFHTQDNPVEMYAELTSSMLVRGKTLATNHHQDQEWGTASHHPDPHWLLLFSLVVEEVLRP